MSRAHRWGDPRRRPGILAAVVAVGMVAGYALSRPFAVDIAPKTLSGLEWGEEARASLAGDPPDSPLPIRLVDAGGVGIPPDTAAWGTTYSHATHTFDQLLLDGAPWVDPAAASAVRDDWRAYACRMSDLGANAIVLDAFLEMVNFDGVGSGHDVYAEDDPLRARHLALRGFFRTLARDAGSHGMDVYLKTDLPAVTPQLARYVARAPNADGTASPSFWEPYALGFEEIFRTMPEIAGVVVRIGEAGPLFNTDTEYASYMGVRTGEQLRTMLDVILPVFERHGRTLIFRSWSVGLGPLGNLHNDPDVYLDVLGPVRSPALVVSTKFVRGDYFGFLPLNPTLLVGPHRRIVEFQARREFEGFGALPNYLAKAHGEALLQIRAVNPNLEGISLWTQEGGPLRAGPLSLYDVAGFWRWTDANVHATLALASDPDASPRTLALAWASAILADAAGAEGSGGAPEPAADAEGAADTEGAPGPDARPAAAALADLVLTSREALEKAWYIRPYARQKVDISGIEAPPILWIFEWDVIGGWSSVLATLYQAVVDDIDAAIAEGHEAVTLTEEMASTLEGLKPALGAHPDYRLMERSLAYQASLFRTLADFRATFLGYYRWLDEGGDESRWRADAARFLVSAADHEARFGTDLDFPAFDFRPAEAFVRGILDDAASLTAARWALAVLLLALGLGALHTRKLRREGGRPGVLGGPWIGITDPDGLADAPGAARGVALLAALVATSGTAFLALGAQPLVLGGTLVLGVAFAAALLFGASPRWTEPDRSGRVLAGLAPLTLVAVLPLSVSAVRGPDLLWLLFWTSDVFRALLMGVTVSVVLAALVSTHRQAARVTERHRLGASAVALAGGVALIGLTLLLPDLEGALEALDEPLGIFPMTHAIINAITHYGGTPEWVLMVPAAVGSFLVAASLLLRLRNRPSAAPR